MAVAKQVALASKKEALEKSTAAHERGKEVLKNVADGAPNKAELEGEVVKANAQQKVDEAAFAKSQAEYATALNNLAMLLSSGKGQECVYAAKAELLPAQADPKFRLVADQFHSPLRDDTTALRVSAGLLSSANVVATDRTGDIIVDIAGAIAGFSSGGGVKTLLVQGAPPDCAVDLKQFAKIIDPTDPAQVETMNNSLVAANFPLKIRYHAKETAGPMTDEKFEAGSKGAIYYRSAVPAVFEIDQCNKAAAACKGSDWHPVDASVVLLPQAGPISYIPMQSSAFVKTVNDVQFTDGSISSWTADRPSEVLEVVRLPVRVLTAIISVPAQKGGEVNAVFGATEYRVRGLTPSEMAKVVERETWFTLID